MSSRAERRAVALTLGEPTAGRSLLELRDAFEHGEFALAFEPLVGHGGRLLGAEALLRWSPSPTVSAQPAAFLPLLERSGMIHSIGHWALRQACAHLGTWHRAGHRDLRVHLNISPLQLRAPDFVRKVLHALADADIPAEALQLELDAAALAINAGAVGRHLRTLAQLGVGVWLDDLGSDDEPLRHVKALRLRGVKLDRSFIGGTPQGWQPGAAIGVVQRLLDLLDLQLIVQGVESAEQARWLLHRAPYALQGFHFGHGIPPAEFAAQHLSRKTQ